MRGRKTLHVRLDFLCRIGKILLALISRLEREQQLRGIKMNNSNGRPGTSGWACTLHRHRRRAAAARQLHQGRPVRRRSKLILTRSAQPLRRWGAGAWLGFVFGVVVTIAVVTGADQGGYIMFSARPVMTDQSQSASPHGGSVMGRSVASRHRQKAPARGRHRRGRGRPGRQHRAVRARHGAVLSAAAAGMGRRHGCGNVCRYGPRGRTSCSSWA